MENRRNIVLSGINLFEGGPLSIYKDVLNNIIKLELDKQFKIIAFVHKQELFSEYPPTIRFIELPKSRENYLNRLYYEYFYFGRFSRKNDVYLWFSLHDITPGVICDKLYTYCHNPSPFLKRNRYIWRNSKNLYIMSLLYGFIYRINIKKNTAVVVQQDWIRKEFQKRYKVSQIIVARPDVEQEIFSEETVKKLTVSKKNKVVFIYPAFPRSFKNYEVICRACELLKSRSDEFEVYFTICGTENKYASDLFQQYKNLDMIRWLGVVDRNTLNSFYDNSDCMIFPSLLETWGLPITEYKHKGKPIIAADLPYAHETVGSYNNVRFFNAENERELATLMKSVMDHNLITERVTEKKIAEPYFDSWEQLLNYIV